MPKAQRIEVFGRGFGLVGAQRPDVHAPQDLSGNLHRYQFGLVHACLLQALQHALGVAAAGIAGQLQEAARGWLDR